MKIKFDERGYNFLEIERSKDYNKVFITLSSRDDSNKNKTIVNSVEITINQLLELITSLELDADR